jgi:hypothetical protein
MLFFVDGVQRLPRHIVVWHVGLEMNAEKAEGVCIIEAYITNDQISRWILSTSYISLCVCHKTSRKSNAFIPWK